MVSVPAKTPVTTPEEETVAWVGELLLHEPPVAASARVIVLPWHTAIGPEIMPAGEPIMESILMETAVPQILVTVYFTVSIPKDTPLKTPEEEMVANDVVLLLQAPPVTLSVKAMVKPNMTLVEPDMEPEFGNGLTVIGNVAMAALQLLVTVYDIIAEPAVTQAMLPPKTVATDVLELLQLPPDEVSVKVMVVPVQKAEAPVIVPADGCAKTLIGYAAVAAPQPFVTV